VLVAREVEDPSDVEEDRGGSRGRGGHGGRIYRLASA
jgi:hypothetical protein